MTRKPANEDAPAKRRGRKPSFLADQEEKIAAAFAAWNGGKGVRLPPHRSTGKQVEPNPEPIAHVNGEVWAHIERQLMACAAIIAEEAPSQAEAGVWTLLWIRSWMLEYAQKTETIDFERVVRLAESALEALPIERRTKNAALGTIAYATSRLPSEQGRARRYRTSPFLIDTACGLVYVNLHDETGAQIPAATLETAIQAACRRLSELLAPAPDLVPKPESVRKWYLRHLATHADLPRPRVGTSRRKQSA